jgi:hypothetical protein
MSFESFSWVGALIALGDGSSQVLATESEASLSHPLDDYLGSFATYMPVGCLIELLDTRYGNGKKPARVETSPWRGG